MFLNSPLKVLKFRGTRPLMHWNDGSGICARVCVCMQRVGYMDVVEFHIYVILLQGLELLAKTSPGTWKGLHKLNLSFNNLGVVCGWSLAQLLKQCLVLYTLQLDSCMLSAAVFSELSGLCEALKS